MKKKMDPLGDRMKSFYESRTKQSLPRRTYSIIRIDGKAFHTYTKGLKRPFDEKLVKDMDETAKFLCQNIQGAKLAFVQSDEISVVLTDFEGLETAAWYDGNIQKMTSVSASLATGKFNELRPGKLAFFDSRVFTIPSKVEVANYLIWRQQDTIRNSISSAAQSLYTTKELHGKSSNVQKEMIVQKGSSWDDFDPKLKLGRMIVKETYQKEGVMRSRWISTAPPKFTADRQYMEELIP